MRRHRFFTYDRKGNQTFTNYYGKLIELGTAAQLENMGQKEYLIFRIIAGINDPATVDKLLSIPQADFNLEEVHRVAVACEAAKNYSGLNTKSENISCKISGKKFAHHRPASKLEAKEKATIATPHEHDDQDEDENGQAQDFRLLSGRAKIKALKESGLCIRCGREMHAKGTPCPFQTTQCHRCKTYGHLSMVCARE